PHGSSFFFQAEDGIRDFHVTGVQTCALPISRIPARREVPPVRARAARDLRVRYRGARIARARRRPPAASRAPAATVATFQAVTRSEERRVGKESSSRRPA